MMEEPVELMDAIRHRRSVRKFTDHYVTDEEIRDVLEAARLAPSWANTQVWEFIVVRERELIRQVTETYSATNPARSCSAAASAVILACARAGISGCKEGKERTKFHEWFMFDLGLTVQNLCLRAYELGLGTVVVGSMNHDACAQIALVPAGYEVVAAIPIGRPANADQNAPSRKELKSFVHLDTFGERYGTIY
jgi:nitroreductase